jgi:uncharacterized protein YjbI with pentapeptide repeats
MNKDHYNLIKKDIAAWNESQIKDFKIANLNDTDFFRAYLSSANLRCANLRDADLRGADLRGADLSSADLRGADLCGAILCDCNLNNAVVSYRGKSVKVKFEEI